MTASRIRDNRVTDLARGMEFKIAQGNVGDGVYLQPLPKGFSEAPKAVKLGPTGLGISYLI